MKTAVARPRRSNGNRSPSSDVAAGAHAASPTPTARRAAKSPRNPVARPETAVIALHRIAPAASTVVRRQVSARRPRGSPTTA